MSSRETTADVRELRRGDLHAHLLLSAPRATYQDVALEKIPELQAPFSGVRDFLTFVARYYLPVFHSRENLQRVVHDALGACVADGVTYLETSVALTAPARVGISWPEFAEILREEVALVAHDLTVRLEIGHARELPVQWRGMLETAVNTALFAGVDLYGDELHTDVDQFCYFFDCARANGLYTKLHCGESSTPAIMRADIDRFAPDQIQHGIMAVQDRQLLQELTERGIPLNVCPTSNFMTGVIGSYEQHPIRTLLDHGIRVRLGTDDFGVFGVSLSEECRRLQSHALLTTTEIDSIVGDF